MVSPLFRKAFQAFQQAAEREFRSTPLGKLLSQLEGLGRGARRANPQQRKRLLAEARKLAGGEVQAALQLIESLNPELLSPEGRRRAGDTFNPFEALKPGRKVEPEPQPGPKPSFVRPRGLPVEEIRIGGRVRRYAPDDPILTGEMIDVSSSNVHSIGFEFNPQQPMKGTLKVRFLQKRGNRTGPGPLYHYDGVHPDTFDAFRNAASKGKFVWDRLRIRGTVSGHRFRYRLVGIANGYVPRQAVRRGSNEYFLGRHIRAKSERTGVVRDFSSQLPDELVKPWSPRHGTPNRGQPNRGEPFRGR